MSELELNILRNFNQEEILTLQKLLNTIQILKPSDKQTYSLNSFGSEYLKYIQNTFSEKYLTSVKLTLKHLYNFYGENKLIGSITVKDVEDFKLQMIKNAPKGTELYFRNIRAAFNKAKEWELINQNPFQNIKFKKMQKLKPKFLSKVELDLILLNTLSLIMKEIFTFGFYTGCRLSEIVNLKWRNINLYEKEIVIGDKEFVTKNGKSRNIPINNSLGPILSDKKKSIDLNNYVFSKDNGFPFTKEYVSKYFKNSVRKAGLSEEFHFHSLRHSFASNLAIAGVPLVTIKDLLGHSSISVTEIYSHTNYESLRKAVDVLL